MKRAWWCLVAVLALGGASACDDGGGGGTDAGRSDSGGGNEDAGGSTEQPVLRAFDGDDLVEPDLSCLGMRMAPPAGDPADFRLLTMRRATMDEELPDTTVQIFTGNSVPEDLACGAGCMEVTTGADATAMVSLPADGWFAYRVVGNDMIFTTAQVNVPAVADSDGNIEISGVSSGLFNTALSIAGVTRETGTAVFTGTATDCAGRPLVGGEVRVFGPGGEIEGTQLPSGVRFVYWPNTGPLPSRDEPYTSRQGRYAGANIPADGTLRLELWGVRSEGGDAELIACEEFPGHADHLTILNLSPLRADAAAGCGGG